MIYELTLRPWLHLATLNQTSRVFLGMNVVEVTREVVNGYAYRVDYRISAWEFSNGMSCCGVNGSAPARTSASLVWHS